MNAVVIWASGQVYGPGKGVITGQQEGPLGVCGHALKEKPPIVVVCLPSAKHSRCTLEWSRQRMMGLRLEFLPPLSVLVLRSSCLNWNNTISFPGPPGGRSWDSSDSMIA